MNRLNIQQGSNVEDVTALTIKSLYNVVTSVPPRLSGLEDNALLKGNLRTPRAYKSNVMYLVGTSASPGRFYGDLNINVTEDYYVDFVDKNLEKYLVAAYSEDNVGLTETDAANTVLAVDIMRNINSKSPVTQFPEFKYFYQNNNNPNNLDWPGAFQDLTNLTYIDLSELTILLKDEFRNTGIIEINAPKLSRIKDSCDSPFRYCINLTTITNFGTVDRIPSHCFRECSNLVTIPIDFFDNKTQIGTEAFYKCSSLALNNLNLPNTTTLYDNVFYECSNITGILNAPNLQTMGNSCFDKTGISTVQCLGSINVVRGFADNTNLTTVHLPYTCNELGGFKGTSLTTIDKDTKPLSLYSEGETHVYNNILTGIIKFRGAAFENLSNLLTTIDLTDTEYVDNNAFHLCSSINFIGSISKLKEVNNLAFNSANLSLINPSFDSLTKIGQDSFKNCTGITGSINLPALTTYGGSMSMFNGCTGITSVISLGKVVNIARNMFEGCTSLTTIYFPYECTEIYRYAFKNCSSLTSLYHYSLTIDDFTSGLTFPTYPKLLLNAIGIGAFLFCSSLTSIDLSDCTLTEINEYTFGDCINLTEVVLPSTVTKLKFLSFCKCYNLSSINLDNITTLQCLIFRDVLSLPMIYFKSLTGFEKQTTGNTQTGVFAIPGCKCLYCPKLLFLYGGSRGTGYGSQSPFKNHSTEVTTDPNIVYLRDISNVELGCFYGGAIRNLVINNNTPPSVSTSTTSSFILSEITLAPDLGPNSIVLWVPRSAISTYRNALYWGDFTTINAIEDMNKVATKALFELLTVTEQMDTLIEEYM